MKVIDDFLPTYQFQQIQSLLMGEDWKWYYNDSVYADDDGLYQYKYTFYNQAQGIVSSEYLYLWDFCQRKLKVKELWRIKVNARPRSFFKRFSGYHIDNFPCSKTAILYINTCNGYTKFKKGGKVKSVAYRMVIFDSDMVHAGVTCSDEKRRLVVNFNYTE